MNPLITVENIIQLIFARLPITVTGNYTDQLPNVLIIFLNADVAGYAMVNFNEFPAYLRLLELKVAGVPGSSLDYGNDGNGNPGVFYVSPD